VNRVDGEVVVVDDEVEDKEVENEGKSCCCCYDQTKGTGWKIVHRSSRRPFKFRARRCNWGLVGRDEKSMGDDRLAFERGRRQGE